jgi:hypothetical protein
VAPSGGLRDTRRGGSAARCGSTASCRLPLVGAKVHRTFGRPPSPFRNLDRDAGADRTRRHEALCGSLRRAATRSNRGPARENGAVEGPHGHPKRAIADALPARAARPSSRTSTPTAAAQAGSSGVATPGSAPAHRGRARRAAPAAPRTARRPSSPSPRRAASPCARVSGRSCVDGGAGPCRAWRHGRWRSPRSCRTRRSGGHAAPPSAGRPESGPPPIGATRSVRSITPRAAAGPAVPAPGIATSRSKP